MAGRDQLGGAHVLLDVVVEQPVEHRRSRAASRCRAGRGASSALGGLVIEFSGIGGVSPRSAACWLRHRARSQTRVLGTSLIGRVAAGRVAVQGRVAGGQLALVAGGQDQVAVLVGQRHQDHAADPGLQVLRGQAVQVRARPRTRPPSARSGTVLACTPCRLTRSSASPTECSEEYRLGISTTCTRSAPMRVGGDRGGQRRVDAAGQAEQHRAEAVLADVVADPEDQRRVDLGQVGQPRPHAPAARPQRSRGAARARRRARRGGSS